MRAVCCRICECRVGPWVAKEMPYRTVSGPAAGVDKAGLCLKPHLTAQGQHPLHSVPAKELAHLQLQAHLCPPGCLQVAQCRWEEGDNSWQASRKVSVL